MNVNLGGNRLGSGGKMEVKLPNYGRSTHDLTEIFTSSAAPGVLYPFLIKPALPGDTFDINLDAQVLTLPTQGPLFSSFKLQVDMFSIPMRLYNGVLHNNPINVGMNMSQIYFPKMKITSSKNGNGTMANNNTSLVKYLGLSGIGNMSNGARSASRKVNAIGMLGYYDVFKNYYANKMETYAYVISPTGATEEEEIGYILEFYGDGTSDTIIYESPQATYENPDVTTLAIYPKSNKKYGIKITADNTDNIKSQEWLRTPEGKWYLLVQPKNIGLDFDFAVSNSTVGDIYDIHLQRFALANIDQMREDILTKSHRGEEFVITETEYGENYPYQAVVAENEFGGFSINKYAMNGLCVKTYQSDIFNAWIRTDWIDGPNGIAAVTAVSTAGNKFTIDSLNLSQKVYEMMNRIAAHGGTYEDWSEAVYSVPAVRRAETPIYVGGLSKEVVFEEVISTAETTTDGDRNALGSLGGRGRLSSKHKGGKMVIHVSEPSLIMGIVSLTPRISYSQGNDWYLTELDTYNDLHKPGLDGIGYENLIGERMAWFDTFINQDGTITRNSYGKLPAWINYMTSFNKVFGDFADEDGKNFMVLTRNYEAYDNGGGAQRIKDATTYIDPSKYNYAFAYNELAAQNFWINLRADITARRVMSAKQIPNL